MRKRLNNRQFLGRWQLVASIWQRVALKWEPRENKGGFAFKVWLFIRIFAKLEILCNK